MKVDVIELPVFGILINIMDGGGAGISSLMHEDDAPAEYDAAIDAIESLILAHCIAGVDIQDPAYLEGIETAVQACANNL